MASPISDVDKFWRLAMTADTPTPVPATDEEMADFEIGREIAIFRREQDGFMHCVECDFSVGGSRSGHRAMCSFSTWPKILARIRIEHEQSKAKDAVYAERDLKLTRLYEAEVMENASCRQRIRELEVEVARLRETLREVCGVHGWPADARAALGDKG